MRCGGATCRTTAIFSTLDFSSPGPGVDFWLTGMSQRCHCDSRLHEVKFFKDYARTINTRRCKYIERGQWQWYYRAIFIVRRYVKVAFGLGAHALKRYWAAFSRQSNSQSMRTQFDDSLLRLISTLRLSVELRIRINRIKESLSFFVCWTYPLYLLFAYNER